MGLRDRDYMKSDYEEAQSAPRRSLWIAAFAVLVLISFVLSVLL